MEARMVSIGTCVLSKRGAQARFNAIPEDYHDKLDEIEKRGLVTGFPRDYMWGLIDLNAFLRFLDAL
jgi:hypothetical protein